MRLLVFNLVTDKEDPLLGFTVRWVKALADKVERVYVITMRAGQVDLPDNVQVYSVGKEKNYTEPRRVVEFYRYLVHIVSTERIDVCFSHQIPIFTILAAPLLKIVGVPCVTWYAHPSLNRTLKLAHHLSDRMVTSVNTAYPYRDDKLVVVGQGIDTELFSPDASTAPDSPPMILCVGRLSPVKDHPTLIRAVSLLKQRDIRPFRVVFVGGPATSKDKTYVDNLHLLVRELGLQNQIDFHGPVPLYKLPMWYRRCTVHVNLSPTGFGDKVAWEAMACAKLCIAANEGFRETMGEYADQLLFRYGDAGSLAQKLKWALALSQRELSDIGLYLRERVVRQHSLAQLADRLVDLFEYLQK